MGLHTEQTPAEPLADGNSKAASQRQLLIPFACFVRPSGLTRRQLRTHIERVSGTHSLFFCSVEEKRRTKAQVRHPRTRVVHWPAKVVRGRSQTAKVASDERRTNALPTVERSAFSKAPLVTTTRSPPTNKSGARDSRRTLTAEVETLMLQFFAGASKDHRRRKI